jgi:hypothetical protein
MTCLEFFYSLSCKTRPALPDRRERLTRICAIPIVFVSVCHRRLRASPLVRERENHLGSIQEVGFVYRASSKRKDTSPYMNGMRSTQMTLGASTATRSSQDRF